MFFAQPPPLFPPGHNVLLPPGAHLQTTVLPGSAVPFAHQRFNQYPMPMMPMFGQPSYQPYQHMVPPSFPPDSWIPVPNLGLRFTRNGLRNPFRGW